MKSYLLGAVSASVFQLISIDAYAALYEFDYTGAFSIVNPNGELTASIADSTNPYYGARAEISGTFYYDDVSNIYSLSMNNFIVASDAFSVTSTSISLAGSKMDVVLGFEWGPNVGQAATFSWNAAGFLAAMAFGVTPGDTISGDVLYDSTGSVLVASLGSATPASDGYVVQSGSSGPPGAPTTPATVPLGPAPLATSYVQVQPSNPPGGPFDIPFAEFYLHFDIGNGNSMTLAGISASPTIVPVPAAMWLFGSGLLGLIGISKRRKA